MRMHMGICVCRGLKLMSGYSMKQVVSNVEPTDTCNLVNQLTPGIPSPPCPKSISLSFGSELRFLDLRASS